MRHGFRLALGVALVFTPFLLLCFAAGWLDVRGIIPEDSTPYVLLLAAAGMLGVLYIILHMAKRRLRRRFLARPRLTLQQWYDEHYRGSVVPPETAAQILTLVAHGLGGGVHATQILPSDRVDEEFVFRLCGNRIDDGIMLSHPLEDLREWLEERMGEEHEAHSDWKTIGDVIREVSIIPSSS